MRININAQDSDGFTALMIASASGHHAVVAVLLDKERIDINAQGMDSFAVRLR